MFSASARRQRMPNLRDSCPPPPAGLRTCGSALLFQQSAPGRFSEAYLQCVLVRHRYLKPADLMLAGQCPVLIDCCCPQNALSLGGEDRPVLVDVSSHHGQECKLRGPSDRHPIVAYSECPDFDPDGRRRVPEETKSWNLGVMLCLHPKLIAICKASYNKEGALVLSDDVRSYDKDSVLSVRYLNRIEGDSCADDGFVSCHTGGPDKVLPEQVPPSALFKTKRLRDERELSPIVNVDSLSVGTKNKKRWRTIGADGAPLRKKARLSRKHPVMNSTKVPCLPEGHYLFPTNYSTNDSRGPPTANCSATTERAVGAKMRKKSSTSGRISSPMQARIRRRCIPPVADMDGLGRTSMRRRYR